MYICIYSVYYIIYIGFFFNRGIVAHGLRIAHLTTIFITTITKGMPSEQSQRANSLMGWRGVEEEEKLFFF